MSSVTTYRAPGPVAARYLKSMALVSGIMGPVGSGKTGASVMKAPSVALRQSPHPQDGIRRTRFAFIRKTYRDLERTLIQSWARWVPKDYPGSSWVGGTGGQPAKHVVRQKLPDGTTLEMEVLFLAIGENSAEEVMRGFELTGVYLNEADTLDEEVLDFAIGRIGRYPAVDRAAGFAGATWSGVWLDFNAPDTEHWIYKRFVEAPRDGHAFFRQPGAFEPGAENLANLTANYYARQVTGSPDWLVRRMVHNQWGYSRDGQPVYPEFNDALHVAPADLLPIPGLKLIVGGDAGLHAGLIVGQRDSLGQVRILDELVAPDTGEGAESFGRRTRRLLDERYPGYDAEGWADPAGEARKDTDERTWVGVMRATTGIPWRLAPTNSPMTRQEAVRVPLKRLIDGRPGFLLSPRCIMLRKGFNSGYRFKRLPGGAGRFSEQPDKNAYSHPHDALQYLCLGLGEHHEALGWRRPDRAGPRQTHAETDSDSARYEDTGGRQAYAE